MAKSGPDLSEFDPKAGAPAPDIGFTKGKVVKTLSDGPKMGKDGQFLPCKWTLPSGNIRTSH